jgi:hypothetical protein
MVVTVIQNKLVGQPFNRSQGMRQGDIIISPIFNIVPDTVICEYNNQFNNPKMLSLTNILFYGDDGAIMGEDQNEVQLLLDLFTSTFA